MAFKAFCVIQYALGKSFLHEIQGANFSSELYREYNRISNTDPDTTCDAQLQELTKIVYQTIKELAKPSKQRKPVIEIKAGKINEYKVIFRGLEKKRFTESTSVKQLFKQLERNLNTLGLKWEDIEAYKPRHNFFDHGKVSAGLLIEGYGIYSSVMERVGESPFFRSVWQIPEDMQALNKKYEVKYEIFEAIFAVLMHNIWVKSDSNPRYLKKPLTSLLVGGFLFSVHSRLLYRRRLNLFKEENPNGKNKGHCRCQPKGRRGEKHYGV